MSLPEHNEHRIKELEEEISRIHDLLTLVLISVEGYVAESRAQIGTPSKEAVVAAHEKIVELLSQHSEGWRSRDIKDKMDYIVKTGTIPRPGTEPPPRGMLDMLFGQNS